MMPLFGGALAACTYHFFYNSPTLDALVALQVCHSGRSQPHRLFSGLHSLDKLVAGQLSPCRLPPPWEELAVAK